MLFFKSNNQDDNVAELQQYVSVNINFPFSQLRPKISEVEIELIIPLIGEATLSSLTTKYKESTASDLELKCIEKIQRVIANLAMLRYTPFNEVQFDKNGVSTINKSDTRTAAYDYQIRRILEGFAESGNNAIEDLFRFLEANLTNFPEYASSAERGQNNDSLITSALEFNSFYHINNSHLTFRALRPHYISAEKNRIIPFIGTELYNELKAGVSDYNKSRLLNAVKEYCVFACIAKALEMQLPFQISNNGLRVHATSSFGNVQFYTAPTQAQIDRVIDNCNKNAERYLSAISSILLEINPPETVSTSSTQSPIGEEKLIFI